MEKYLRINEVVEMLSVGKSIVWASVKESKFPKPIKLSEYVTVWKLSDIENWVQQKEINN
jgi:prophage regulatory protein